MDFCGFSNNHKILTLYFLSCCTIQYCTSVILSMKLLDYNSTKTFIPKCSGHTVFNMQAFSKSLLSLLNKYRIIVASSVYLYNITFVRTLNPSEVYIQGSAVKIQSQM